MKWIFVPVPLQLALTALLLVFAVLGAGPSRAEGRAKWPGPFAVTVLDVQDGDTVQVALRRACPFGCVEKGRHKRVIAVRLRGIDTPEIHACRTKVTNSCASCPREKELALAAQEHVRARLPPGAAVRVVSLSPDKYQGRVVGDLQVLIAGKWRSVSAGLLAAGLAVPYAGKTKLKTWCGAKE